MSITDELRKWAEDNTLQDMVLTTYPPQHAVHGVLETLLRIADRIDAEHEMELRETGEDIVRDVKREWVRLPLDADGVPIRVGDSVEYLTGGRDVVRFLTLNGSGWTVNDRGWEPFTMRHHHAPTVEDVLQEFAAQVTNGQHIHGAIEIEDAIAEFAAKLRLAGDAE